MKSCLLNGQKATWIWTIDLTGQALPVNWHTEIFYEWNPVNQIRSFDKIYVKYLNQTCYKICFLKLPFVQGVTEVLNKLKKYASWLYSTSKTETGDLWVWVWDQHRKCSDNLSSIHPKKDMPENKNSWRALWLTATTKWVVWHMQALFFPKECYLLN